MQVLVRIFVAVSSLTKRGFFPLQQNGDSSGIVKRRDTSVSSLRSGMAVAWAQPKGINYSSSHTQRPSHATHRLEFGDITSQSRFDDWAIPSKEVHQQPVVQKPFTPPPLPPMGKASVGPTQQTNSRNHWRDRIFAPRLRRAQVLPPIQRTDIFLALAYICNMFAMSLSVVTVPALASASFAGTGASNAFESTVASMAPLGGAIGKVVNGFVVQHLGGRTASWLYLVALAGLLATMSCTSYMPSIGFFLMAFEFLSSIQWTSICMVLDETYKDSPKALARGIALMSFASYYGTLAAKTLGATMLNLTGSWRTVTQIGAGAAVLGALSMIQGVPKSTLSTPTPSRFQRSNVQERSSSNPLLILRSVLTNRMFWMVGVGHSLGYIVRQSDRLLIPFLNQVTGFSRTICATLTSSITVGYLLGLRQGTLFSQMERVADQMALLKRNYFTAIGSFLGLGLCSIIASVPLPYLKASMVAVFSGLAAYSVSFQFSQVPTLVSSVVFPMDKAVALSLVDAAGFLFTSQALAVNTRVLGQFGWASSWTFLSLFLGLGSSLILRSIEPILEQRRSFR
eukprot:Nitzschia sp. Nitz4//scaffold125_size66327//11473//13255//NITZ4_006125-RA/size66327-augustus-gene-0.6-mRNA-1//-1//CDS//3329534595//567//frame0